MPNLHRPSMTPEEAIDAEKHFSKQFRAFIQGAIREETALALNPMRQGIAQILTSVELLKDSHARMVQSNLAMANELGRLTNQATVRQLDEDTILRKVDKFLELLKTIDLADLKKAMPEDM